MRAICFFVQLSDESANENAVHGPGIFFARESALFTVGPFEEVPNKQHICKALLTYRCKKKTKKIALWPYAKTKQHIKVTLQNKFVKEFCLN